MGLNFRKSFNLGGRFKINLSKSGIGYSFNTFGGRVTRTASGKVNYKFIGFKQNKKSSSRDNSEKENFNEIKNADIENFQPVEYRRIIDRITKSLWVDRISNLFIALALISFINKYFLVSLLIGLFLKILTRTVLSTNLEYNLNDEVAIKYIKKVKAWSKLKDCNKLWQVMSESKVVDKKAIAGIERNVVRAKIKIIEKNPFFITSNVHVVQLKLKNEKLIFLPEKVLIVRGCKVGVVDHNSLIVELSEDEFIEVNKAPNDAKIIEHRWKYVNKNGEPDKRYKDNKKIPVYLYGVIYLRSEEGLNIELNCSNVEMTQVFKYASQIS